MSPNDVRENTESVDKPLNENGDACKEKSESNEPSEENGDACNENAGKDENSKLFSLILIISSTGSLYLSTSPIIAFSVYYPEIVESFELPGSKVAWLGSIQAFFMFVTSIVTGVLVQMYGCRRIARCGSLISCLSLAISFFHSNIYLMYVIFGACTGIGMSMILLPSTVIVQQHFRRNRALAAGISYCGINICFLTIGPIIRLLLNEFGFHGVVLIHGALMLQVQIFAFAFKPLKKSSSQKQKTEDVEQACENETDTLNVVEEKNGMELNNMTANNHDKSDIKTEESGNGKVNDERVKATSNNGDGCNRDAPDVSLEPLIENPPKATDKETKQETAIQIENNAEKPKNPAPVQGISGFFKQIVAKFDRALFQETNFVLMMIAGACIQAPLMSFHQHFVRRAIMGGVSKLNAAFLPTCIGIAAMTSRVTFGFLGSIPRINRIVLYAVGTFCCGAVIVASGLGDSFKTFIIVAVLNGLTSGLLAPLRQTILVDILGVTRLPQAQGCTALFSGLATLLASPFAGYLAELTDDYNIPFYVMGSITIIGACMLATIAIRNQQTRCLLPNENEDT